MKLKFSIVALCTVSAAWAAEAVPFFNAMMTVGQDHRFVLVDQAGVASKWLRVGDSFEGYALKSFDGATGMLEVSKGDQSTKLSLVAGAGVTAAAVVTSTPATLADAEEMFRVMRFDEMMSKVLEQQRKAMAPMLQQIVGRMKVADEDKEAVAAFQQKVSNEMMSSMMGPEMKSDMAKIYSEVFSKEELNGLTSFYSTSTGQALIDKQPDVQQKMMAAIMPRMMQVMPKIQQMGKDFAAEMAAKKAAATPAATVTVPGATSP